MNETYGIPQNWLDTPDTSVLLPAERSLPVRARDSHKGDYGRVFILAGSRGYTGAPCLAARAAVRGGAGLVTLAVPEDVYPIVAAKCCDEVMVWPLPEDDGSVVEDRKSVV